MTGGVQTSAGLSDIPPPNLLGSTRKSPPAPRSDAEGAPASVPCHSSSAAKVINRGEGVLMCRDLIPMGIGTGRFPLHLLPMRVGVWQLFGSEKWGAGMLMSKRVFFLGDANQFCTGEKGGAGRWWNWEFVEPFRRLWL